MRSVPRRSSLWLYTVLGMSLALNAVWLASSLGGGDDGDSDTATTRTPSAAAPAAAAALEGEPVPATEPQARRSLLGPGVAAAPTATTFSEPPPAPALDAGDLRVARARLTSTIPQSLAAQTAPQSDAVSAAYSRLFMWDLDLRRDLRAGDELALVYHVQRGGDVQIEAAHYDSGRHATRFTAYRFQATGATFPSYWTAGGDEVARRLLDSPLEEYEQVTSLLHDRPNHHGMDFKTPVGTPVHAPFAGRVTRVDWNWRANGNCVEIAYASGVLAKFLHLSESRVAAGEQVRAGQVIALTGNTGHSTGPHLHYQLNRGTQVLDPVDVHGTERRALPAGDRAAFDAVVRQLDAMMQGAELAAAR